MNTSTLKLIPLKFADSPALFQHAGNDSELWRWLPYKDPHQPLEMENIVKKILAEVDLGNREAFAIVPNDLNQAIGVTCFLNAHPQNIEIEIGGTFIGRKFWRTRVNTEVKLLMLTEAFEVRKVERVTFKTDNMNTGSQEAIERLGAQKEGILRHQVKRIDGSWRDSVYYSILSSEWPSVKARLE
jgi:RimJ/RimL family protein N-acetyltransferase